MSADKSADASADALAIISLPLICTAEITSGKTEQTMMNCVNIVM